MEAAMLVIGMFCMDDDLWYFPVVRGAALGAYQGLDGLRKALGLAEYFRIQEIIDDYYKQMELLNTNYANLANYIINHKIDSSNKNAIKVAENLENLANKQNTISKEYELALKEQNISLDPNNELFAQFSPPFELESAKSNCLQMQQNSYLGFSLDTNRRMDFLFIYLNDDSYGCQYGYDSLDAARIASIRPSYGI